MNAIILAAYYQSKRKISSQDLENMKALKENLLKKRNW
jgi:hypothetical protein